MSTNVLVNALGIRDSGGMVVLENLLHELSVDKLSDYYIICSNNNNIVQLIEKYHKFPNLTFSIVSGKGFMYRLYYENIVFRRIVKINNIKLIYNFSGTAQFFIKIPQLIKVQNLLFFSKRLDSIYMKNSKFLLWVKQIFLKRLILKFMLNRSKYIEIQSDHVKNYLSDFIKIRNKTFYVKSDINVSEHAFSLPKKYDFSKKIGFLYIVGPHFESIHKNFIDFTNAMLALDEQGVNFEINITLDSEQLKNSNVWNSLLDTKTNFIGYISDKKRMKELYCDNAILISTSIIETLGLHVIDGIKNGVITIAPHESYANVVYGENMVNYELFNSDSLLNTIMSVINFKNPHNDRILSLQKELKRNEMSKYKNILDIFDEVANV